MPRTILPIFDDHPEEGQIIGRLVVGYGEIEHGVVNCLGAALGDDTAAIRVMFRARGEEVRLQIADALMRPRFHAANLEAAYSEAFSDAMFCRRVRNQYAHCHWYKDNNFPFSFIELEDSARKTGEWVRPRSIDLHLLKQQEAYFIYTDDCLSYLASELKRQLGQVPKYTFALPKKIARPSLHNGGEQ